MARKPKPPTAEAIQEMKKPELLEVIDTFDLDIEPKGMRIAELREAVYSNWYAEDDEEEEEDVDTEDEVEDDEEEEEEDEEEEDEAPAPKSRKKSSGKKSSGEDPDWQEVLDQLNSSTGGDVQFLKDGKNYLKLALEDEDDKRSFYTESVRVYKGERRTKYLIRAVCVKLDPPAVKAVPVGKNVMKAILSLLAEGYDLLDPDTGHGITVVRAGKGFDTSYTVMPSPKPVPMPDDVVELDRPLEEVSEELTDNDINRDNRDDSDDEDDDDKPKRGSGRKRGKSTEEEDW